MPAERWNVWLVKDEPPIVVGFNDARMSAARDVPGSARHARGEMQDLPEPDACSQPKSSSAMTTFIFVPYIDSPPRFWPRKSGLAGPRRLARRLDRANSTRELTAVSFATPSRLPFVFTLAKAI